MGLIADNIFWILIVAGALTSTMLAAAVAPRAMFASMFGTVAEGPLGNLLMRNWAFLVGASGLLMIYSAFEEPVRVPAILLSVTGKLMFAWLVFAGGKALSAARMMAIIDVGISAVLIAYLAGAYA